VLFFWFFGGYYENYSKSTQVYALKKYEE